jgi:hypothetical protein
MAVRERDEPPSNQKGHPKRVAFVNSSAGWTPARSLREESGLASITGSSEAAPKTGNPNRTNRLLGITRHRITSFQLLKTLAMWGKQRHLPSA